MAVWVCRKAMSFFTIRMYIKVHVIAGAKKELIKKRGKDAYDISVREPAEQNMANRRVLELIAQDLGIPKGKVRIITGHHSPGKILSIIEDK